MNAIDQDLRKRQLAYILHLGCVEVRKLAQANGQERLADLADALEILPRFLDKECSADDVEMIRCVLKSYQDKHNSSLNFPAVFEDCTAPQSF